LKYRAEIDGLRALAVVPVILFHAGFELFSGGFVGVDVFFVISGYLITTILIEDIENQRFSIVNFYERRARRILPALYTVAATSTIASSFILYPEYLISFAKSLVSTPLFSANFYFWSERGYFGESSELKPLIHFWSLAVEGQFYIVFPIFLLVLSKCKRLFYSLLIFGMTISLASSYFVTKIHFDTAFYFPFTRAWELLAGSVAALLVKNHFYVHNVSVAEVFSSIGLSLIFYSCLSFDNSTPFPGFYAAVPVLGTFLFVISASATHYVKKLFSFKPIVFIGLLSYSLYLWHQPIFALARHLEVFESNLIAIALATVLFSYITYRYVETPFRNKLFISRANIFIASLIGGVLLIFAGLYIVAKDGFINRYSVEDRALLTQLGNYQDYNQRVFDSLEKQPFENSTQKRIVIVGDSYAKDLMNIIVESNLFTDIQFSTRQVNSVCGNLYLQDYSIIEQHIPSNRLERCRVLGWYGGHGFNEILTEADEIWLAASWREWVIDYLPQSINNLTDDYGVTVRVFGMKNFGEISPYELLSLPSASRVSYTHAVTSYAINVSIRLSEAMDGYEFFYPLLTPLCGGNHFECRIFNDNGLLLSADGGHLTREGAISSANRIRNVLEAITTSLKQ